MDFKVFGEAVRKRFDDMATEPLFVVDSDREAIWETYINAFPAGSNPIYRKRTEHDCSCCRAFIRQVGNVVAIRNGALASVWDLNGLPPHYQAVADAMSAYVKRLPIKDAFFTKEPKFGTPMNRELDGSNVIQWTHFNCTVAPKHKFPEPATVRGAVHTTFDVLYRGIIELTPEAVETVAGLIEGKHIYRGEEFKEQVLAFQRLQQRVLAAPPWQRDLSVWSMVNEPVARFRNTVIGTLVTDLSAGVDLEDAVKMYESKVAPQNFKRSTALITKSMVEAAMKTIQELGLEPALERRHAKLSDVSVNSVLFVDNAVRGKMKDGVEGLLMEEVKPVAFDKKKAMKTLTIEEFIRDVLPGCKSISLYLENTHMNNFVSMTAPVHANTASLFKWGNDFAWSYDGNVTDSIKDRVKKAGGKVEGLALRVSLAWHNTDDLDLHIEDSKRGHIYFGQKESCDGGRLDVDMNVNTTVRNPVENIRWVSLPREGTYKVYVHQFTKRESIDVGFTVEIERNGRVDTLSFNKAVPSRAMQGVAMIVVKRDGTFVVMPDVAMVHGSISQDKWGLKTLDLVRVNSIVLSPNHWGDKPVGNKHWFFILEGCKNPEPTRGIYNEFLNSKLDKHRKVFEVLGDKTKCPVTDNQLSGVGFSSTRGDEVTVVAMGPRLNMSYTIVF